MTTEKQATRARRFLRMLSKASAIVRETGDPAIVLLEFAGDRSVRCPRESLEFLANDGLIERGRSGGESRIVVTGAGLSSLRRSAGDAASQHRQLRSARIVGPHGPETVTINDRESPLSALARLRRPDGRSWFDRVELAAGERLRGDFELAMMQPRVTSSWDFSRGAKAAKGARNVAADISDSACAARMRVNRAVDAVGPDLGGPLLDVCCFLKGLEQVEAERGWPRRSAKLMIKTGLAALDRHYHPPSNGGRRPRGILHWGDEGYRPAL